MKVKLRQWIYEKKYVPAKNEKEDKKISRLILNVSEKSLIEMIKILQEKLDQFKTHYYINKRQSNSYHQAIENVPSDTIVLQVDFSEKFSIKFQDEAQSAY